MNSIVEGYTRNKTEGKPGNKKEETRRVVPRGLRVAGVGLGQSSLLGGKFTGVHFVTVLHQLLTYPREAMPLKIG